MEKKSDDGQKSGSEERPTPDHGYAKTSVIFERLRPRHHTTTIRRQLHEASGAKDGPLGVAAKKERWLRVYAATGQKPAAHRAAGVTASAYYRWLMDDEQFKRDTYAVEEQIADTLEAVAMQRALGGSDFLLTVLLNANRPQKFRPTRDGMTGNADPEAVAAALLRQQRVLDESLGLSEDGARTNGSGRTEH